MNFKMVLLVQQSVLVSTIRCSSCNVRQDVRSQLTAASYLAEEQLTIIVPVNSN